MLENYCLLAFCLLLFACSKEVEEAIYVPSQFIFEDLSSDGMKAGIRWSEAKDADDNEVYYNVYPTFAFEFEIDKKFLEAGINRETGIVPADVTSLKINGLTPVIYGEDLTEGFNIPSNASHYLLFNLGDSKKVEISVNEEQKEMVFTPHTYNYQLYSSYYGREPQEKKITFFDDKTFRVGPSVTTILKSD